MLYLIYPDVDIWNYMLQDYKNDSKEVVIRPLNRFCYRWQLVIRKLFRFSSVCPLLLFKPCFIREIKHLNEGDSILLCDYAEPVLTNALNTLTNKVVKKHFWIWNPVTQVTEGFYSRCFDVMRRLDFRLSTFDEADAVKYQMECYNQFFRMIEKPPQEEIYDFYFVGYAKDREEDLVLLQHILEDMGFKTLFIIVHNQSEVIPYVESIRNILMSKCVVEYVQHGQSGMTLRPLEALCFHKKLLTNNTAVTKYSFFNANNIFILDTNNHEFIKNFLCSKAELVDQKIIEDFSVLTWINHFQSI